ncbi:MAG: cytidine deaminase [Pseudonocardiaceae bacterium]|nr:cytidine deaminase [Pseudonocardiaceae bacterium]
MPDSNELDQETVLDPEDAKLVTLARSMMARTGSAEGAAVRDTDGRTYTGCTVALPSLTLSALQSAVAAAVASGALGLEAAAVVTGVGSVDDASLAAARDLGPTAAVFVADPRGALGGVLRPSE